MNALGSASGRHAVAADVVFDGTTLHRDCAVLIEGGEIIALMPRHDLPGAVPVRHLPDGAWLAPGFIDAQVNGGGDVLFNDTPTVEGIAAIVAAHRRFGTTALLPTLISDTAEKMQAAWEECQRRGEKDGRQSVCQRARVAWDKAEQAMDEWTRDPTVAQNFGAPRH